MSFALTSSMDCVAVPVSLIHSSHRPVSQDEHVQRCDLRSWCRVRTKSRDLQASYCMSGNESDSENDARFRPEILYPNQHPHRYPDPQSSSLDATPSESSPFHSSCHDVATATYPHAQHQTRHALEQQGTVLPHRSGPPHSRHWNTIPSRPSRHPVRCRHRPLHVSCRPRAPSHPPATAPSPTPYGGNGC